MIKRLIVLLLFFALSSIQSESFRTKTLHIMHLPSSYEEEVCPQVVAGINDAIAVFIPATREFLQGVELEVKIPEPVAQFPGAVAFGFYNKLKYPPSENRIDYSGNCYYINTFPQRLNYSIKVPLTKENYIKETPYSIKVDNANAPNDYIFFRIRLVMKGTSDELLQSAFEVQVKPIYIDKGRLSLDIYDEITGAKLALDKCIVTLDDSQLLQMQSILPTGEHHLVLTATGYRNEVRTINIEQAKTMKLSIAMRDINPSISIIAPSNARLFFDDIPIENNGKPFVTKQGEHMIKFIVGNYETQKLVTVSEGHSYRITLNMDAVITESE